LSGSLGAVTWRHWAAISGELGVMTWQHWAGSLASLGAGDVASLDGCVGGVERWWLCQQAGPSVAQIWAFAGGARRRQWWPRAVDGGGSGERRDEMVTMCDMSDVSTAVVRFGNSRVSITNQR